MAKWFNKKKAAKEIFGKQRASKDIHQEYANVCSDIGDCHFKMEMEKAKTKNLTLKLASLKDEYQAAIVYEQEIEKIKATTQKDQSSKEAKV